MTTITNVQEHNHGTVTLYYHWYFGTPRGEGFALTPVPAHIPGADAQDDGGRLYRLPDGYTAGATLTGEPRIYTGPDDTWGCVLDTVRGEPHLYAPDGRDITLRREVA